jgi:hypothetical protein
MNKRPLSVTLIGCLFLVAGTVGLVYHATDFTRRAPFQYEVLWVSLVRVIAVVGAIFLLRGHDWARWLLVAWLAFHVVLSALHSVPQAIFHAALLAVIAYFLFRRPAAAYFRAAPLDATAAGQ